ncbi:HAD family hydrolase [Lentzea sp. DG1S-22]|uniref:HAD family hydrolase n=1 Tax=Lentzea sp. DG1S-22 TaxID=3108822 RepID=UPI002E7742B6|nr:HAD family hydrolase [Lentzea sp. DG1S-22]WVH78774.1 HAD family hydrolase [Lentzea sp. DG1S-22]
MEQPRLVASDVDGTLLTPPPGDIVTPRTAAVVARVLEAGVPFVLATGRPPRWVPQIAKAAGLDGLAVCANGAVLYDIGRDEIVWARTLDPVQLHDIVSAIDNALPGCAFAVERVGTATDDVTFVAEISYTHPWPEGPNVGATRAETLGHPAIKLLVRHTNMTSGEMAAGIGGVLGDQVDVTWSTNNGLIELSVHGVTKASGLADVVERFGVTAQDVIAFGDMPNDVEMLRWAGHGVAMANGHEAALAAADEVTASSAEDGVALVLERWF